MPKLPLRSPCHSLRPRSAFDRLSANVRTEPLGYLSGPSFLDVNSFSAKHSAVAQLSPSQLSLEPSSSSAPMSSNMAVSRSHYWSDYYSFPSAMCLHGSG